MTKASPDINFVPSVLAGSYSQGVREGLEMAARIADRHSALQQHYASECGDHMPNSAQAFLMQKVAARQMATQIRDVISSNVDAGRTNDLA